MARRDGFLRLTRTLPEQLGHRAAAVLVHLQHHVVGLARFEEEIPIVLGGRMIVPCAENLPSVDPQPDAVIADGEDAIQIGVARHELSSPAHRERLGVHAGSRSVQRPVEVHRLRARDLRRGEVRVVVVHAEQAGPVGIRERRTRQDRDIEAARRHYQSFLSGPAVDRSRAYWECRAGRGVAEHGDAMEVLIERRRRECDGERAVRRTGGHGDVAGAEERRWRQRCGQSMMEEDFKERHRRQAAGEPGCGEITDVRRARNVHFAVEDLNHLPIETNETIVRLAGETRSLGVEQIPEHSRHDVLDRVRRDAGWQFAATIPRGIFEVGHGERPGVARVAAQGAGWRVPRHRLREELGEALRPRVLR